MLPSPRHHLPHYHQPHQCCLLHYHLSYLVATEIRPYHHPHHPRQLPYLRAASWIRRGSYHEGLCHVTEFTHHRFAYIQYAGPTYLHIYMGDKCWKCLLYVIHSQLHYNIYSIDCSVPLLCVHPGNNLLFDWYYYSILIDIWYRICY